jgi:hypothetical protein
VGQRKAANADTLFYPSLIFSGLYADIHVFEKALKKSEFCGMLISIQSMIREGGGIFCVCR